jgi:cytochrome c oxidase cbb3-type subunit 3
MTMRRSFWLMPFFLAFAGAAAAVVPVPTVPPPATAPAAPLPPPAPPMPEELAIAAEANYQRYCSLCHGADRQGHVNDDAPSLRSRSLLESSQPRILAEAIAYGRPGTAMAGFLDEIGGPMTGAEIVDLNLWLLQKAGTTTLSLPNTPVAGDVARGAGLYAANCARCHGDNGEGGTGTALANAAMLALTPDTFLRHAIANGRQDTPMPAFAATLGDAGLDDVTAFLRSRGGDWSKPAPVALPPPLDNLVLNPGAPAPTFELREGLYVSSEQLDRELKAKRSLVLLDTRVPSVWRLGHIEGAAPLPYYSPDEMLATLPRDGTWIVAYCECPRAAAESVVRRLRADGFLNTAVLYEGIQGWVGLGYPIVGGSAVADPPHGHAH